MSSKESTLFVNSFKKVLEKKLLINQNIAYLWKDVRDFSIFDYDLVYTFDESFSNQDWKHMMNIFNISPRCKFLILFRYTKPASVDHTIVTGTAVNGLVLILNAA